MRLTRRTPRFAATWALPLALWTALPAIQWCPTGWDQVCAQMLLVCSAVPNASSQCSESECPLMGHAAERESSESRAYCLDGPNGGAADVHAGIRLHAPERLAAEIVPTVTLPPPVGVARRAETRSPRPPPRAWPPVPPARAPPSAPSI